MNQVTLTQQALRELQARAAFGEEASSLLRDQAAELRRMREHVRDQAGVSTLMAQDSGRLERTVHRGLEARVGHIEDDLIALANTVAALGASSAHRSARAPDPYTYSPLFDEAESLRAENDRLRSELSVRTGHLDQLRATLQAVGTREIDGAAALKAFKEVLG